MAIGDRGADVGPLVYMATNLVNGKRYIGITIGYLCHRKAKHINNARHGREKGMAIVKAIRKYGEDMFRFRVIKKTETYSEAKMEERRLIALLKPEYNLTKGGDGCEGFKFSPEQCKAISERKKGQPGYWKGKRLPAHVMEAAMAARREKYPEYKHKLAAGPKAASKPVICIETGNAFESASAAARALGLGASQISSVCAGKKHRLSAGGFHFRYADAAPSEIRTRRSYRGADHPSVKLTEEQVRKIFSLWGEMSKPKIAALFSISVHTVKAIHNGRLWAHLNLRGGVDGSR